MLTITEGAHEARVRRQARRNGLQLVKSRKADSAGTYGLVDAWGGYWVAMGYRDGYGLDLEDVAGFLADYEASASEAAVEPQ